MRLESSNLVLIPLQFTDANDLHQAAREALTSLNNRFSWAEDPFTVRHIQTLVQDAVALSRENKGITFAIRNKTGRILGAAHITNTPDIIGREIPMHRINIWLRPGDNAEAHLAEALQTVTLYAQQQLQSKRMFTELPSYETSLIGAYQQTGFQQEGILRKAMKKADGLISDMVILAKVT